MRQRLGATGSRHNAFGMGSLPYSFALGLGRVRDKGVCWIQHRRFDLNED